MGLAEKRWVAERKKADEESLRAQLKELTQMDVPVEVNWDGFSANLADAQYLSHDSDGLPNLVKALKDVMVDDLGKQAVKSNLEKVVIKPAASDQTRFTFQNGVIEWQAYFGTSSSGSIYADQMKQTLEDAL